MTEIFETLDTLFEWVVQTSWRASVLAGLVLLSQRVFRRWLSPRWMYRLWFIPLICLLIPSAPKSNLSVFNLVGTPKSALVAAPMAQPPAIVATPLVTSESAAATPLPTTPQAGRRASIITFLQLAWLGGFLFLALRFFFSNLAFSASIARVRPSENPAMLKLLEECKRVMGVRAKVSIIRAPQICSPVLMGVFRPKLLLPRNPPEPFNEEELRFIFLHELAHLKQGDIAINWITTFAQTLHWFNPVIWFALSRMRAEREVARDHLAISCAGGQRSRSYGLTILKILQNLPPRPAALPALSGMLETKYQLKHRFSMIAGFRRTPRAWAALSAGLVSALAVTGLTVAEETPAPASSPELVAVSSQRKKIVSWLDGKTARKVNAIYLPEVSFEEMPIDQAVLLLNDELSSSGHELTIYVLPGLEQPVSMHRNNVPLVDVLREVSAAAGLIVRIDEFQGCVLLEPESMFREEFGNPRDLPGYDADFLSEEFVEQAVGYSAGISTDLSEGLESRGSFHRPVKLEQLLPENDQAAPEPPKSILTNMALSNQPAKKPAPWPPASW